MNFAFDVTPAELVTAIVTEAGVLEPPYEEAIAKVAAVASRSVTHRTQTSAPLRRDGEAVLERLPDGASILIRPIRADDKRMLEDGLRHLSDESVQRRFLTPKRSFSRAELRYLTEVDGRDHAALVAEDAMRRAGAPPDRGRSLRPPRRGSRPPPRWRSWSPTTGSAAASARCWPRGWPTRPAAPASQRFTATMASDNVAAHKLMAQLTTHLERRHGGHGVSELVLELAA